MTIWRRWISGGASAPARDLAGRFVPGGASALASPPSSVRAAILAGSCDDIVGGDDASEPFRAEFLISARIATFRCTLSKTLRGKRPGAKEPVPRNLAPRMPARGSVSPRAKSASLSEGASYPPYFSPLGGSFSLRYLYPHLVRISSCVTSPAWRGASLYGVYLPMRHISPNSRIMWSKIESP